MAKGFTHILRIDYNKIFSPVVKHCSIRILMVIVNQYNFKLEQFLHSDLEETVYMGQ